VTVWRDDVLRLANRSCSGNPSACSAARRAAGPTTMRGWLNRRCDVRTSVSARSRARRERGTLDRVVWEVAHAPDVERDEAPARDAMGDGITISPCPAPTSSTVSSPRRSSARGNRRGRANALLSTAY